MVCVCEYVLVCMPYVWLCVSVYGSDLNTLACCGANETGRESDGRTNMTDRQSQSQSNVQSCCCIPWSFSFFLLPPLPFLDFFGLASNNHHFLLIATYICCLPFLLLFDSFIPASLNYTQFMNTTWRNWQQEPLKEQCQLQQQQHHHHKHPSIQFNPQRVYSEFTPLNVEAKWYL